MALTALVNVGSLAVRFPVLGRQAIITALSCDQRVMARGKTPISFRNQRPYNPYSPRMRENSWSRGRHPKNLQNLRKGGLEALAFGKSSRISNRPAMVHAFTAVA
jgi:hypothetical protein